MCSCDLTMPSTSREHTRAARLVHTCDSCGYPIVRGERYVYTSGIWDKEPNDYKRHELCALLESRTREVDGCGVGLGELCAARDGGGYSWVFRRAWETVLRRSWNGCEDCGETLPYRCAGPLCPSCLAGDEDLWATHCP